MCELEFIRLAPRAANGTLYTRFDLAGHVGTCDILSEALVISTLVNAVLVSRTRVGSAIIILMGSVCLMGCKIFTFLPELRI